MAQQRRERRNFIDNLADKILKDIGIEARVYQATDTRDETIKALKVYSRTWNEEQFNNEIEIYGQLRHENIIRYLDSYTNHHLVTEHFILMEFCEGKNLRERLKEYTTSVEPDLRNRWIKELIAGIAYLHKQGLIHGDIHPRNIMIDKSSGDMVKIGDFRIMKYREDNRVVKPRGSLRYQSPEVVNMLNVPFINEDQRDIAVRTASDIWSFGCIVYEIVHLTKVFTRRDQMELMTDITNPDYPIPLLNSGNNVLDEICSRALNRDPVQRQNAERILNELRG